MYPFDVSMFWMLAGSFGAATASAVIPWVNAELLLLAAAPTAATHGLTGALICAVTLGQMVGKSGMYWTTRLAADRGATTADAVVGRWRSVFEAYPRTGLGMVFLSATCGIPPFYIVSIVAGGLRMAFLPFVAVGTAGRLLHFGLLAWGAAALWPR